MDWMLMPLRRYADFQGRSRRMEYWMFVLAQMVFYFVAAILFLTTVGLGVFLNRGAAAADAGIGAIGFILILVFGLAALALIIPNIAVQVRRFHDQGLTGWLVLLGLIPYVGGIIVFVFMLLPGKPGPNQYGPDPKHGSEDEAAYFS